eukprot:GSMAST32.ASY1.ANO1.2360.1 assembled CDS
MAFRGLTVFISDLRNCKSKEAEVERVDLEMANIRKKFTSTKKKLDAYNQQKYVWKMMYMWMLGYEVDFGHMELMTLIVNSVRNDLTSGVALSQGLALSCIANLSFPQMAEATREIASGALKKRAALCLLRIILIAKMMESRHLGLVTCVAALLLGLISLDFKSCTLLEKLALARNNIPSDYMYYIKLLKILQYYPKPTDTVLSNKIIKVLQQILKKTVVTKSVNKNNADHGVLFEAINLIIHYGGEGSLRKKDGLKLKAVKLLARFMQIKEPNIRYLGLATMYVLCFEFRSYEHIKKYQGVVIHALKDADISIRKRSLDLLFVMCDESNSDTIVQELVEYLGSADINVRFIFFFYYEFFFRTKFYTILRIINTHGVDVADDVWHRCVQIISNHEALQSYASATVYDALQPVHVSVIKAGSYILGEYGYLLADHDDQNICVSGAMQFETLHQHFDQCTSQAKAIMIHTYIKMANLYPEDTIDGEFWNTEIQQRSNEYVTLLDDDEKLQLSLDQMPPFPADKVSNLVLILRDQQEKTSDKNACIFYFFQIRFFFRTKF